MAAITVVDAGVIIAALSRGDHHPAAVAELTRARLAGEKLQLPSLAYSESLVGAVRGGAKSTEIVRQFIGRVPITVIPLSSEIAERAARIRASVASDLRLGDAVVLATAFVTGAGRLVTTDRPWPDPDQLKASFEIVRLSAGGAEPAATVATGR